MPAGVDDSCAPMPPSSKPAPPSREASVTSCRKVAPGGDVETGDELGAKAVFLDAEGEGTLRCFLETVLPGVVGLRRHLAVDDRCSPRRSGAGAGEGAVRSVHMSSDGAAGSEDDAHAAADRAGVDVDGLRASRRSVAAEPNWSEAHKGLGQALYRSGELDAAIAAFERAVEVDPTNDAADSHALYCRLFRGTDSPIDLRSLHERWADRHTAGITPLPPAIVDPSPDRRLRVGYVSPNFRNQAVVLFILPILENYDPWEVEVFCYSDTRTADAVDDAVQRSRRRVAGHGRSCHTSSSRASFEPTRSTF